MYELIPVSQHDYYIECPAKIGVVRLNETDVCLIDSGSDKDAGKKVLRHITQNGWTLRMILCTHSHADHIGGCRYLQAQTGCKIYAPGIELAFTLHPVLEPSFLYGGDPCRELRHKFLMAQECSAELLTPDVLPDGFEIIPLTGHSFDMIGLRTPDDTVYLADCLSSAETLGKYRIAFLYDVVSHLETLEKVKTLQAKMFVPAHAEAAASVAELAQRNIDQVHGVAQSILELCMQPLCFEDLLQKLFEQDGLSMNFQQYVLVGSTVRSYLTWLKETGRISACFENNRLLWRTEAQA